MKAMKFLAVALVLAFLVSADTASAGSGRYLTTVNSRYLAGVTGPPGPASGTGEYSSQGGVDIAKAPTGASTSGPLGDTPSYNAKGASGSTSPNPAGG